MSNIRSFYNSNWLLFKLIIVFILFDGVRDNLIFGSYLTILRESLVLILAFRVFKKKYIFSVVLNSALIAFVSYHTVISLYTLLLLLFGGEIQVSFIIKPYLWILAIYVFYYFHELTNRRYSDLLKFFVNSSVWFVFINITFYFIPCPLIVNPNWWGRISIGYPTMDVVSLSYGLLILYFNNNLSFSYIKKIFYILILEIGIILNASGTGLFLLCLIVFCAALVAMTSKNISKLILGSLFVVITMTSSLISYVSNNYPQEYKNGCVLLDNKINIFFGKDVEQNTMEIRQEQFAKQVSSMNFLELIMGKSLVNVSTGGGLNKDSYMIEDQYQLIRVCYGYIGLGLFVLVLVGYCYNIYLSDINKLDKIFFCLTLLVFMANSKTLISLILYPNYMCFAMFYSIIKKRNHK